MMCLTFNQGYLTFDELSIEAEAFYNQLVITSRNVFEG